MDDASQTQTKRVPVDKHVPRRQGLLKHGLTSCSHERPVYPGGHIHWKVLPRLKHVPLFTLERNNDDDHAIPRGNTMRIYHGSKAHWSIGRSHNIPVKLAGHAQKKEPLFNGKQVPSTQRLGKHGLTILSHRGPVYMGGQRQV